MSITFQRSFKPDEMESINKSITAPLQNDSVFFDGTFLFRCGLYSSQPFTEKWSCFTPLTGRVIRIMRITGPLLPLADSFLSFFPLSIENGLIPYGIALMWYNPSGSAIPYSAEPVGAQNLLPCVVDIRSGTNGFYVLHFACKRDILITVELQHGA